MSSARKIKLSPEQVREAEDVFDRALALSQERRPQFVKSACHSDVALQDEVLALLQAYEESQSFLAAPSATQVRAALNHKAENLSTRTKEFRPRIVGKYILLRRTGEGGMAEIFQATASGARGFEKQVAIKGLLPSLTSDASLLELFENEARINSVLSHSNIAQVYDFFSEGDHFFLSMEFVEGKNLREVQKKLRTTILPTHLSCYIMGEVAKGLAYAHSVKSSTQGVLLGILHRDISPKNIMMSYEGEIKIVDFGIAKARDQIAATRSATLRGTFNYLSPEQALGQKIDHRTDIFSAGLVLYELLTGAPLFKSDQLIDCLDEVRRYAGMGPYLQGTSLSEELRAILSRALAAKPEDRYDSADQLYRELHSCQNQSASVSAEAAVWMKEFFKEEIETEREELLKALAMPAIPLVPRAPSVKAKSSFPPLPADPFKPGPPKQNSSLQIPLLVMGLFLLAGLLGLSLRTRGRSAPAVEAVQLTPPAVSTPALQDPPAPIGEGDLELTLSHDTKIYVEGKFFAETIALSAIKMKLSLGSTHHFRFVNERLGINVEAEYKVRADGAVRAFVELNRR